MEAKSRECNGISGIAILVPVVDLKWNLTILSSRRNDRSLSDDDATSKMFVTYIISCCLMWAGCL
jgi:hypothetical protein